MKDEFATLLRLRFDERNRRMTERFTEEKQRLNARGLLNSSETVKAMHKVVETELKESAAAVVATAVDVLSKKNLLIPQSEVRRLCDEALSTRKDEIEALYLGDVRHVEQGLQNKAMLQPYMSLGAFYRLQREEMLVTLSAAHGKYMRDRGGNLVNVIKNRFLDRPLVAWGAVVIAVILVVAAFADAIGDLLRLWGNG